MTRLFSAAAEQNRQPILDVLQGELTAGDVVLELGAGSGQHASFFGASLPDVIWQPTDVAECMASIDDWTEPQRKNVRPALALDVRQSPWPDLDVNVCYTANTFHIMALEAVDALLLGCAGCLDEGEKLCVYGPFSFDGQHTSDSNRHFDEMLRQQNPDMGVRDLTQLDAQAATVGFGPSRQVPMPANNLLVIWSRLAS